MDFLLLISENLNFWLIWHKCQRICNHELSSALALTASLLLCVDSPSKHIFNDKSLIFFTFMCLCPKCWLAKIRPLWFVFWKKNKPFLLISLRVPPACVLRLRVCIYHSYASVLWPIFLKYKFWRIFHILYILNWCLRFTCQWCQMNSGPHVHI